MYGSENQYIVDVQKSLGETIEYIEKGNKFEYMQSLRKQIKIN